jgi:integrase
MRSVETNGRDRTLDDSELRDLFAALEIMKDAPAFYPAYIKTLLLTAARRTEVAGMHFSEIDGDLWVIPGERYKRLPKHRGVDHVVPLSRAAREVIGPLNKDGGYIFSSNGGRTPFSGFSKSKAALDRAVADIRLSQGREPMPAWGLHDLRRTARTLMTRAGVMPDHAERALGHVIGGIRGTYDRYKFLDEKRDAFERLAALINTIASGAV